MAIKELFYDQRPVALLNPRASKRIDPRFKFTRNSTGTYVDSTGIIRTAGANQPRISANPYVASQNGLIIEPERTNHIHFSEDLTNSGWSKSNLTVSKQTIAGPAGYIPYDKVTLGTFGPPANSSDYSSTASLRRSTAASLTPGTKFAISIYLKAGTCRYVQFIKQALDSASYSLYFDLQTGTQYSGGDPGNVISGHSIQPAGNGWYRIVMYGTELGPGGSDGMIIVPMTESNPLVAPNGLRLFTGNGQYIYAWGGQYEEGTVETSYIPTFSAADVTRSADLLSVDSVAIPGTGSIYVDAQAASAELNSTLISLKNASNQKINLAMEQRSELYNSLALTYSIKGTVKPTLPYPVPTTNRERNIITWGSQNYQYNTDGARFAPSLSTTPGIPANLTQLSIGHDAVDPTKAFNGYINAVYLYNGEITPTVAEALVRGELDPINADTYSPVGPTGSLALIINTQGASSTGDKVFALPATRATVNATAMVAGQVYRILTVGTSNFTLAGATANTVGTVFTATGTTTGTGTVAWQNDIVVTWGDGTESGLEGAAAEATAAGLSHTYPSAGIYPLWVEGRMQNLYFNNSASAPDLVKVETWGTGSMLTAPSTMNSAFYGCSKLTSIPSSGLPNTSAVADWYRAFRDCSSLTGTFPPFNFSAATSFFEAWYGCSGLTSFTAAGDQTQNVTNFIYAWYNCSGLTSFPLINTSAGTTFYFAWYGCSGLTSFPLINTAAGTNFSYTWRGCSGLTSFPLINTAAGTDFSFGWYGCAGLTSFPLINTAAGTNFSFGWYDCAGLTSFPLLNTATGSNFLAAWYNCAGLTSFPAINTALGTEFGSAWQGCSGLTSFPLLDTAAGTGFVGTWSGCSSLTSFPVLNTAAGTNFSIAWLSCTSLSSFPSLNLSAATGLASDGSNTYTGFRQTWEGCTSLTTFPASMFNTTTCTRFLDAFKNCALSAASIENIIVSINAANTSNGNLGFQGGTNAAKSTWTANANNAYNALVARGWTITFNP